MRERAKRASSSEYIDFQGLRNPCSYYEFNYTAIIAFAKSHLPSIFSDFRLIYILRYARASERSETSCIIKFHFSRMYDYHK